MHPVKSRETSLFIGAAFLAAPIFSFLASDALKHRLAGAEILEAKNFALIVLVYPLIEEVIFRGLLQGELLRANMLRQKLVGVSSANILVSAIFAFVHMSVFQDGLYAIVFVPSIIFGLLYETKNTLLLPWACHAWYNFSINIM